MFPTYENFSLAKIIAKNNEKVHFRNDSENCQNAGSCILRSYLVNNDNIIIANQNGNWTCAWYFGKKNEYVGWIPSNKIKQLHPEPLQKENKWTGTWMTYFYEKIVINKNGGSFYVSGVSEWHGGKNIHDEDIVHLGEFNGVATPIKNKIIVKEGDDEYDCVVEMQLVGDYLIATDNGNCGGMNVRFNGVYRKR